MSRLALKVENLNKAYQLGNISTGTISRDIERWYARVRGKEDPYSRIGEQNDQRIKSSSNIVWSLKDINFEIKQGEIVGIIGRNGAGKSTLLKILSKITSPTSGKITGTGRVASLLEVGTGFHPELSGRENIFLNGTILGMRKKEISKKLDEIVEFAGVERYLDTPVKRYSSGMYVRLAFAVAAHLESEILIVDEVLAVGDIEFQRKCLGKMGEVSKGEGKTVLFVSHNMDSIKKLCNTGFLLENGELHSTGHIDSIIQKYLNRHVGNSSAFFEPAKHKDASILKVELRNANLQPSSEISLLEKWHITVEFEVNVKCRGIICGAGISTISGTQLNTTWHKPLNLEPGKYTADFAVDRVNFAVGKYNLTVGLSFGEQSIHYLEDVISFEIIYGSNKLEDSLLKADSEFGVVLNAMESNIYQQTTVQ